MGYFRENRTHCKLCGIELKQAPVGRKRKFCSDEHQRQWWIENRAEAGKVYTYTCQNCDKEYQTLYSNRDTCCSRECGWELTSKQALVEKQCLSCGCTFEAPQSGSDYCSDECHERGAKRVCLTCGVTFYGQLNVHYCSDECKPYLAPEYHRVAYLRYARRKKGAPAHTCRECGKEFVAPYGDKRRGFCSDECSRRYHGRIHKRTRRALKKCDGKVDRINPLDVYERDGWRCGICGKKVTPRLKYPHPKSPSLDHIVPLSRGGAHAFSNLQLAHLKCNVDKRDGDGGGGQLRLGLAVKRYDT